MYRIVCKFTEGKRTPTGGRYGRWTVVACMKATTASIAVSKPVLVIQPYRPPVGSVTEHEAREKLLVISSPVPKQPNSMCSPRKILDAWLMDQRWRRNVASFRAKAHDHFQPITRFFFPPDFETFHPSPLPLADPPYARNIIWRPTKDFVKLGMYFPEYPVPLPYIITHPDEPAPHRLHDVEGT